jgi:hypothetical protein
MSLGMNSEGASGMHATGAAPPWYFYDYPSMGSDNYINNLLSGTALGHGSGGDSFFSLNEKGAAAEGHAGGHEEKSSPGSTLLKWGIGILAAAALWKMATRKQAENTMRGLTSRLTGVKDRLIRPKTAPAAEKPEKPIETP